MSLPTSIPQELVDAINQNPEHVRQHALIYLCGLLQQSGQISEQVATQMLGVDVAEWQRLRTKHGFTMMNELQASMLQTTPSIPPQRNAGLQITPIAPGSGHTDTSVTHDQVLTDMASHSAA